LLHAILFIQHVTVHDTVAGCGVELSTDSLITEISRMHRVGSDYSGPVLSVFFADESLLTGSKANYN
jgi:hypothetical protein